MFLQSNHRFEVEIRGILLPRKSYNDYETQYGKRNIIEITENQLKILKTDKIFNTLLEKGEYVILNEIPTQAMTVSEKLRQSEIKLNESIKAKDKTIAELQKEIESLKKGNSEQPKTKKKD